MSKVSMSCIFFQNVLAAAALVGGRAGVKGARVESGVSRSVSQAQWLPCWEVGLGPEGLEQDP